MRKRKILAQGDRDGACFLYSAANAGFALTGKEISTKDWTKAVRSSPFDMSDFMAGLGTDKFKLASHFENIASDFLSCVNKEIDINYIENISELKQIRKFIDDSSVLILGVDNDKHWLTVVDIEDGNLYCACSSRALSVDSSKYVEVKSPNYERYCNLIAPLKELKVGIGYGLHISLSEK